MPLPDRISYSSWQSYRNGCQWRWKLDVVDGLRSNNFGIYMDFGTAVHEAIELYKTRKNPLTLGLAQEHFEKKFKELLHTNSAKYREKERELNPDDFISAGKKILEHLERCKELWDAEVVYNEYPLLLPLERSDGIQLNFKGFIDMVIKTVDARGKPILYIVDFKTCSWGWDGEKRQDRELHYQLFLYKHFLCKKFNLEPKQVRTAFVLLKRRPSKGSDAVEFFPISAGPVSVQRALDAINSDITDMHVRLENNTIQKNRKMCKNEFGDVCPYFNTDKCPGGKDD